jgi:hypothetical protein
MKLNGIKHPFAMLRQQKGYYLRIKIIQYVSCSLENIANEWQLGEVVGNNNLTQDDQRVD